ncbi:MAG: hypothetical protein JSW39_15410 [Desulfobacterales bacterium]|nr:MAG: hypothetical protein JSW39_15410 [Desulfobacterales bacterium]
MKPTLGMIVALASEARALLGRGPWQSVRGLMVRRMGLRDGTELIVVCSGVGIENAQAAARWLISEGVTALVGLGVAGGLYPGSKTGDLVIAESVLQVEGGKNLGHWDTDAACVALSQAALTAEDLSVRCGTLVTTPRAVLTVASKAALFRQTRALAVDMESAAVARAARDANLPFFTLRAICDAAEDAVPFELPACLDKKGKVRLATLLRKLTRRPSLVVDLQRMGRQFAAANDALRRGWLAQIRNNLPSVLARR